MVFLEPDPFLTELTKLYERNRQSGTVWVTLKRSTLKKTKKPKSGDGQEGASVPEASDYRCLVRASDGKRKISASVGFFPSSAMSVPRQRKVCLGKTRFDGEECSLQFPMRQIMV
eukprot:TRINITY_DN23_c0_g1_i2.p1 TRINITY_DN23_c0_g1~~TRINITY_DN23_c0_g1_i2.p1  ORF type:complete len:115 (-),score=11.47 TRINITY_DN23_c0_g1_i2:104-448(-)